MTKSTQNPESPGEIDWPQELMLHDRWLRTVAHSRLRDWDAVDEVMQNVALAAIRTANTLTDPTKTAPWLYRVTVRQCLLYRRQKGRYRRLVNNVFEAVPPTEHSDESSPLAWLLADERRELVRAGVSQIDPRDAEILLLKYTERWSYRQIAQHLGVSESAVEARLHRARKRLRTELRTINRELV